MRKIKITPWTAWRLKYVWHPPQDNGIVVIYISGWLLKFFGWHSKRKNPVGACPALWQQWFREQRNS